MEEKKKSPEVYEETPWLINLCRRADGHLAKDYGSEEDTEEVEVDDDDWDDEEEENEREMIEEEILASVPLCEALKQRLKEGHDIEYEAGTIHPNMDENGKLIGYWMEISEEHRQKLLASIEFNPSLN